MSREVGPDWSTRDRAPGDKPRVIIIGAGVGGMTTGCYAQMSGTQTRIEVFDVARVNNPHLRFGHGAHFCPGAALARMELQVLSVLRRRPRRLVGDQSHDGEGTAHRPQA